MEVQAALWQNHSRTLSENGVILREAGRFSSARRQGESTFPTYVSHVAEHPLLSCMIAPWLGNTAV